MKPIMQPTGKSDGKRTRRAVAACRAGLMAMIVAATAIAARAQTLANGGFESGSPPTPTDWTLFNFAYMTGTNCPADANNTCAPITAHGGAYSLKTFGPFGTSFDASGAFQDFTGVTPGQTWKLSGYALNWSGEPMSGSNGWGVAQIQFLDATNGLIQVAESARFGTDTPLPPDQWTAFQAVGTVPPGTVTMRIQVLHIGMAGTSGSVWWDDIALSQRAGTTNVLPATVETGVQISWPTVLAAGYQPQLATNLSASTVWTNFGPLIIGSSNSNQFFDAFGSAQQKFYRIKPQ
jgi:hypothetical protein